MEAVEVLRQKEQQATIQSDLELVKNYKRAIFEDAIHSLVEISTDITLVEFIDYKCGYCKKAHGEVEKLLSTDGNIRFIIKEFPILGEDSLKMSKFALAVKIAMVTKLIKLFVIF